MKKEKEILVECDLYIKDVRLKLDQQLRSLEHKTESQAAAVQDIQDFFKRRGEIELEYAAKLDKLSKAFISKQKTDKQKRDSNTSSLSTNTCLSSLVQITKRQGRDHSVLAHIYTDSMTSRLSEVAEDHRRIFNKTKEVAVSGHEELLKLLTEMQTEMKQYHQCHTECVDSEVKLKQSEDQLTKASSSNSKKLKVFEVQTQKKRLKYDECREKAVKARNEYLLTISAVNAATSKYFEEDLSLVVDCTDLCYHNGLQRTMLQYVSCLESVRVSHQNSIDAVNKSVQELDSTCDKQVFLKDNSAPFAAPRKVDFHPHRGDPETTIVTLEALQEDLVNRFQQIQKRVNDLKLEHEETWKSVEAVDTSLMEMYNVKDYDVSNQFKGDSSLPRQSISGNSPEAKKKRLEMESYYFQKFKAYLSTSNLLARLHAKHKLLKGSIGEDLIMRVGSTATLPRPQSIAMRHKPKRIGKSPVVGQPKTFGCDLEEYIQVTGEKIPRVMESCIRAVNRFGMHHEGIFRVSGLHAEITEIKAAFEKGDDPLLDLADANCINSVASVLKSFFRELKDPLFPSHMFDDFVSASSKTSETEAKSKIQELINTLPPARIVVMRYLFAFLNHLSQYSDENLMQPYNLAVCFGPAVLPIPSDRDQVAYQSNVNDVIKMIIVSHDSIFTKDNPPGPLYQRMQDSSNTANVDNSDEEDEDTEVIEAIAAYDYTGRTDRELSFTKGSTLVLVTHVSDEWWEGSCDGKEGLIPDKYVQLKSNSRSSSKSGSLRSNKLQL